MSQAKAAALTKEPAAFALNISAVNNTDNAGILRSGIGGIYLCRAAGLTGNSTARHAANITVTNDPGNRNGLILFGDILFFTYYSNLPFILLCPKQTSTF